MFKTGFLLSTDEYLFAAMFNRSRVSVWQGDVLLDYGVIEAITEKAVTISGQRFLKAACQF